MSISSLNKSKINSWLSHKENVYFISLLAVALIIRVYYLFLSKGQVMWWDEAEYMSAAKHWALGVPYSLNEQRPPLFQLLGAGLIKLGFTEIFLKFLLVLLPSIALIVVTYYLGKELFGSKVALIGALGTSFVWSLLFWSVRFQPDFISVTLQLMAFLFFWKFVKSSSRKHAALTGLFCAAGFYFKISALLVPLSIGLFLLYKDGWKAIKVKNHWIILGSFIIGLIPFMIWQTLTFGSPLAFGVTYSGDFNEGRTLGWEALKFYSFFSKTIFYISFLLGLVMFLLNYAKNISSVFKNKSLRSDPWFFSFIVLLVISAFYVFYIKGTIEDRWVFLMIPFTFFFAGKFICSIYDLILKNSKFLGVLFLGVLFLSFILPQINHSTNLINDRKGSYLPVKEASLLIKENSSPLDKILSISYTQTTAYAEREVITYSKLPIENFTQILKEDRPKFVIVSILEPHHPDWMVQQVRNQEGFTAILFSYFNSTVILSPQNQIVQYDVKKQVSNEVANFSLIYPLEGNFGGLLAYKIDYLD